MRCTSDDPADKRAFVRHLRWVYLGIGCVLWAILGARQILPEETVTDFWLGWVTYFAFALACIADAEALGRPLSWMGSFLLLILLPFAAPFYLIQSRGWRGVIWIVVHALTLLAVAAAAYGIVWLLR